MEGYYAISEMAHLFDLSRQTLIYYDRIGLFHPAYVNDEGYRYYAPTQIPYLRLICLLRDMGVELKEIGRVVEARDVNRVVDVLDAQADELVARIAALERTRDLIDQRRAFYREVKRWQEIGDQPIIRYYPERIVVVEPWGVSTADMSREVLHPALMRAISRLHDVDDVAPVAGWGSVLRRDAFRSDDPLCGAGSFVAVPAGVDASHVAGATILPEGEYVCQCRWGMPYEPSGLARLCAWMDEHRFEPAGDAFDFCLLDTTSYTENHAEDLCVMQIPLAFS